MSSSEPYLNIEQDSVHITDDDGLPTYDDIAAQQGPNSRFGRWRGWIEKRAAERYQDITPSERDRRRERGWGNDQVPAYSASQNAPSNDPGGLPTITKEPPTPGLHIKTSNLDPFEHPPSPAFTPDQSSPTHLASASLKLQPTHLRMNQFGSRFLPHTTTPIRCLLPLLAGRLLLIGHEDGLSVLDMYPQEWTENGGITMRGPDEAQSRLIWHGESVYQMSILEVEHAGEGIPQGVVLMLVSGEPSASGPLKDEPMRILRMYNLASLISLAKWAVAQKGSRPLDLRRPSDWNPQQSHKKHKHQNSIARSLRALLDSPNPTPSARPQSVSSYQALISPATSLASLRIGEQENSRSQTPRPIVKQQSSHDSQWDVVDDLPLRWATDFVPLATPGSRLLNSSVISYALWGVDEPATASRGARLLAIATKANILLYEAPKGERSFRFLKEFYTPIAPRNITFFQQIPYEVARSPSDAGSTRSSHSRHGRSKSFSHEPSELSAELVGKPGYGAQLSLFIVFDKKAGWIRLADAAVGELEYTTEHALQASSSGLGSSPSRRSRISMEHHPSSNNHHHHSSAPRWAPISRCELPTPTGTTMKIYLVTKTTETQLLPCPLPIGSVPCPPLFKVKWKNAPSHVHPRVSLVTDDQDPPYLQLVGMGEHGVEVQEIPISVIFANVSGKGKGKAIDSIRANEDAGGDTGFLCVGGHWDTPEYTLFQGLSRSASTASEMTYDSVTSSEIGTKMKMQEGMYGWCRKGVEDWRIFWLGGPLSEDFETAEDDT